MSPQQSAVVVTAGAVALLAAAPGGWVLTPTAGTRAVAAGGAALTVLAAGGIVLLGRRLVRGLRSEARRAGPSTGLVLVVLLLPGLVGVGVPAGAAPGTGSSSGGERLARPVASGGPWAGRSVREGRTFLAAPRGAPDAGRVYVDLAEGAVAARVRVAVEQWRAGGGRDQGMVLVAVPTGSGWVDPAAVAAAERVAGGDLTTVVVPYAQRPSWLETLLGGSRAEDVTGALVTALRAELDDVPAARRPRLVVFGESLGARAALAVAEHVRVDACLAAGTPVLRTDVLPPGGRSGGCHEVANADDPVSRWSPGLLVRPPEGGRDGGAWLPVVTFWQACAELLVALDQPEGHGHRYGGALAPAWREVLAAHPLRPAP
ncbi:alpha/beta-hydrolase family protein [Pseudokineococcus sp. 1T1Z-3]|uniref:alpha/beta-hydrolase family protein n=1 Tax=Pseudokineococcus sp. 1T1Z-3 TaxID=3132745 RepID=UPI0030B5A7FE